MTQEHTMETISLDGPYLDLISLKQEGYCCSQIVVKLVLKELGLDNPDLVRAVAALCFGTGGTCGILTGAACALSLALRGNPQGELPDTLLPLVLDELTGWFNLKAEKAYGGSSCRQILEASPDKRACSRLLISTMEKLQAIIATTESAAGGNHARP